MPYEEQQQDEVQELGLSTAKRGIIYLAGEAGTSLITAVMLIALARLLQPSSFGIYSIAVAFSGLLAIGSTFGVGVAFRKMLPEVKQKSDLSALLSNGYFLALAVGLVVSIIGLLLSSYIAQYIYHNPAIALVLELAAIGEFLSVLFNLGQAAAVGLHMVKEATWSNVAYSVFSLIGSVGLVIYGYGYVGAVMGMLIGLFVGSIVSIGYIVRRIGFKVIMPKRKPIKELTTFSVPVVTSQIATQGAQNLGVLILGVFAASAIVGNYGAAFKFARVIELGITAITFVLLPAFSTALMKKSTAEGIGKLYNKSLHYTSLIMFPAVAYLIAVSAPLVRLLFSASYTTAPLYFAVIATGMALGLVGTYAGTLIVGHGDTKKFMKYQVFAVVIQIALLLVLTPTYQAIGVLVALFAVTPIVLDIVYIKALEGQFKVKHELKSIFSTALASIVLGFILYYASTLLSFGYLTIIVDIVLAILIYPPAVGLLHGVTKSDIKFMRDTAERLKPVRWLVHPIISYSAMFAAKD